MICSKGDGTFTFDATDTRDLATALKYLMANHDPEGVKVGGSVATGYEATLRSPCGILRGVGLTPAEAVFDLYNQFHNYIHNHVHAGCGGKK